jgi:glycosyltransferase involved in cell wall biosynthesis
MRIALASDWWPPRTGGVESQLADLAAALGRRGHTVRVLTPTRNPVEIAGTAVEHVDLPTIGEIAMPDFRHVGTIAARLEAFECDVLHAHGMFSSFGIGAVLAAHRLAVPSVSTVHSLLRPWPVFLGASALFRAFTNRAAALTAVSNATADDVRRASGRTVAVIPNGVALADWRIFRRESAGVRIAAVTRLVPRKSPIDLIHAVAAAIRRRGADDVVLRIAGDGPERGRLEREADRLGVRSAVEFHGECSRAQVRELLAGASFLAHPGTRDAFGLALLEARAAGVPVVAMAAGGVPELVEHRRHGLLARSRREFHTAVAAMTEDEGLRRRCAEEASRGLERYDWTHVVGMHEAVYMRIADRRYTSGRQVKKSIAATI